MAHEVLADASAKLTSHKEKLHGNINVGQHTVKFNHSASASHDKSNGNTRYEFKLLKENNHLYRGYPLKTQLDRIHDRIGGYLTYPNPGFGKLAFTLVPEDDYSGNLKSGLYPEEELQPVQTDNGIPTSTSIRSMGSEKNE